MPYTEIDRDSRRDARGTDGAQRAFSRHIDCDDDGRGRRPVNPSAAEPAPLDVRPERTIRSRLDLD
jgi:hypothetical protein